MEPTSRKIRYQLCDEHVLVPSAFSRKSSLRKNVIELSEVLPTNAMPDKSPQPKDSQAKMLDSLRMDSTTLRYTFMDRMASLLAVLSLVVSCVQVYAVNTETLYYLGHGLTALLLGALVFRAYLLAEAERAKDEDAQPGWARALELLLLLPHATAWTEEHNYLLHLASVLRLSVPLAHSIHASFWFSSRGYRIIRLYGILSHQHFFFALKCTIRELNIPGVLTFYGFVALLFGHLLYLSRQIADSDFMDGFESITTTMPTLGYGEYDVVAHLPRFIICILLIISAALNSFITLSMLKVFEMKSEEFSSYRLLRKLHLRGEIEHVARNYLMECLGLIRRKAKTPEAMSLLDFAFRKRYQELKAQYHSLNSDEVDSIFIYFKETCHELQVKTVQTNNMTHALLRFLLRHRAQKHSRRHYAAFFPPPRSLAPDGQDHRHPSQDQPTQEHRDGRPEKDQREEFPLRRSS